MFFEFILCRPYATVSPGVFSQKVRKRPKGVLIGILLSTEEDTESKIELDELERGEEKKKTKQPQFLFTENIKMFD